MAVITHFPPKSDFIPGYEELDFLAGPIQGAPDWQADAAAFLSQLHNSSSRGNLHIANPRREYLDEIFNYDGQIGWEKQHLKRASKLGGILFWFAAQDMSLPYEEGRPYAKTTYKEFYRAIGWKDYQSNIAIAFGTEPGYGEHDRYTLSLLKEHHIPVYDDLYVTCDALMKAVEARV